MFGSLQDVFEMKRYGSQLEPKWPLWVSFHAYHTYETLIVAAGAVLDLVAPLNGSFWRAKMDLTGQKGS